MEPNSRKKQTKLGTLWAGLKTFTQFDGTSVSKNMISISLGSSKNSDPKYNTTVELTVKDSEGRVIHKQTNGYLNLVDPRTFSKNPERIPADLKYDVLASTESPSKS